MDLYLFPGGYGGVSLIEENVANLCFVVRRETMRGLGGWPNLLSFIQQANPHLAESLKGAEFLWEKPLAISSIPYGYLASPEDGLWRLGDQAACIPSFTGDGMSIALHSGALAAQMFLGGAKPEAFQKTLRSQLASGIGWATWLSRMVVSGAGRRLAPAAFVAFPHAMNLIAASTRIPDRAVKQTLSVMSQQRAS